MATNEEQKEMERLAKKSLSLQFDLLTTITTKQTWLMTELENAGKKAKELVVYNKTVDKETGNVTITKDAWKQVEDFIYNMASQYYWGNISDNIKRYIPEINAAEETLKKLR